MAKRKSFDQVRGGLNSLLKTIEADVAENHEKVVKTLSNSVTEIPIKDIEANPGQPRKDFDEEALAELASSIKTYGLIQPITVRHIEKQNKFQIISGERRFKASKIAGLSQIPAYVRIANDNEMLEMALVENIQREDLNSIEIATTYDRLIEECELTHDQLADRVGKKRSTVTNYLSLLNLPPIVKKGLKEELISTGHAKAIKGIKKVLVQEGLYERAVREKLSVRELEDLARAIKGIKDEALLIVLDRKINDEQLDTPTLLGLIRSLQSIGDSLLKYQLFERILDQEDAFSIKDLGDITRFMATIEDEELKKKLYGEIQKERTTLLHLASYAEKYLAKKGKAGTKSSKNTPVKISADHKKVEDNLSEFFERPIKLKVDKAGKGQIVIPFDDKEALNKILDILEDKSNMQ